MTRSTRLAVALLAVAVIAASAAASAGAKPPPWAGPPGQQPPAAPAIELIGTWDAGIADGLCYSLSVPSWAVPGAAQAIGNAVEDWERKVGGRLTLTESTAGAPCDVDVTIEMRRGGGTVQGVTYPSYANGFLTSARIEIKGKFAGTTNDLETLALIARHEFGHALGLGHWNVANHLMSPYLNATTAIDDCEAAAVRATNGWYLGSGSTSTPVLYTGPDPYVCS